jgi:hypothetical protein
MELRVPIELYSNLEMDIKYQNINLICVICRYMKWNKDIENELIKELVIKN